MKSFTVQAPEEAEESHAAGARSQCDADVVANLLHQRSFPQGCLASSVGQVARGELCLRKRVAAVNKGSAAFTGDLSSATWNAKTLKE